MALGGNSTAVGSLSPALRGLFPYLSSAATAFGATNLRITSARRSRAQQKVLYANYLAGKSKYPALPPGQSKHERGLAVDIVPTPYNVLYTLGPWWRSIGGRWDASDAIHFEI